VAAQEQGRAFRSTFQAERFTTRFLFFPVLSWCLGGGPAAFGVRIAEYRCPCRMSLAPSWFPGRGGRATLPGAAEHL